MRSRGFRMPVAVALCVIIASAVWSDERVIYVDAAATGAGDGSSWSDAYRDLQDALADANEAPSAVIRVAQGTYRPGPPMGATLRSWQATFQLHNRVTLEGGYAGVLAADPGARDVERYRTILSGDLAGDDSPGQNWTSPAREEDCIVVVTGSGTDEAAVIDGFTITGPSQYGMRISPGSPHITRCRFVDNPHAGIYASDCNSVLTECVFEGNGHRMRSGGVFCAYGNLTMTDCVFIANQGAAIRNNGALDLLRCSFTANTSFLAVVDNDGRLTARQCLFTSNHDTPIDCRPMVTLVDCVFAGNTSRRAGAVDASGVVTLTGCEFAGNVGNDAAVTASGDVLKAEACLFAGNSSRFRPGAIDASSPAIVRLSNCTFVGNRGWPNTIGRFSALSLPVAEMSQCIVWDGPDPFTRSPMFPPQIGLTYSNVQGGYPGEGNVDVDPLFVDPGHWDSNDTPEDVNDDVWVTGDYHLKSQAGHWDRAIETWVFDEITSPCVDAGDPNAPLGAEPFPNGGCVNLGAYSGTLEASRSYFGEPLCETHIAGDINGDCRVDDLDMDILMSHWLMPDIGKPNVPPTVVLTSPEDGAELTAPTPIVLEAQASDADGFVLRVRYTIERRTETSRSRGSTSSENPRDDWQGQWDWRHIDEEGTYVIWAEATDDDGAIALSPKIRVTLHP